MFLARDEKGVLFHVLEEQEVPKSSFYCPVCGGELRFRKGKVMQAHFAHVSLKNCAYSAENESREHLALKAALFSWTKQHHTVQVEAFLKDFRQIADLLVENKIALEVQCSPLKQSLLQERTQNYLQHGYQVLWLLGKKLWLKQSITALQKDFLYYSQNMGFHLWELDLSEEEIRLKYMIHEDLHGKVQYQLLRFPFNQGNVLDILRTPFKKQPMTSFLARQDRHICHYVRQQLYYRNPKWMKLQKEYYQRGDNLLTKPAAAFYPQVRPIYKKGKFCQIQTDLQNYYQNFDSYYQKEGNKDLQVIYPPAFYAFIKSSS